MSKQGVPLHLCTTTSCSVILIFSVFLKTINKKGRYPPFWRRENEGGREEREISHFLSLARALSRYLPEIKASVVRPRIRSHSFLLQSRPFLRNLRLQEPCVSTLTHCFQPFDLSRRLQVIISNEKKERY